MMKSKYTLLLSAIMLGPLCSCDSENETPEPELVTGAIINVAVGGPDQPNQVFIDLSTENQTVVNRGDWDLAFYTGPEFRVKLNSSSGMLAKASGANRMDALTAEDTAGLGGQLDLDAIFGALLAEPTPEWIGDANQWIDDPEGDLTQTAIAEVSAVDDDNLVHIINRGKNPDNSKRGWRKVRILRSGEGYLLQHAEINADTFEEVVIDKQESYNFTFFSFDEGIVEMEPEKTEWDIAFTTYTNLIPLNSATFIPYFYRDYVIQNSPQVKTAQVNAESGVDYDNFTSENVSELEFAATINAIGDSWRIVGQPGGQTEPGVNENLFYVVSDAGGNYYKLRFTRLLHNETGERGHPQIEYELLSDD